MRYYIELQKLKGILQTQLCMHLHDIICLITTIIIINTIYQRITCLMTWSYMALHGMRALEEPKGADPSLTPRRGRVERSGLRKYYAV